jgi:large-conductance mechanosensitive channel
MSITGVTGVATQATSAVGGFYEFLTETDVIPIGVAFVISQQINQVTNDFVDDFITPIIEAFTGTGATELKNKKVTIFGIEIRIGSFLASLIKFLLVLILVYLVIRLTIGNLKKEKD